MSIANLNPPTYTPSPKPLANRRFNTELVAEISHILSAENIPNVLFGDYVLQLYGIPSIVHDVAFIIDERNTAKAATLLSSNGLTECTDPVCPRKILPIRPTPFFHAHVPENEHLDFDICLVRKSETLWRLSSFIEEDVLHGNVIPANSHFLSPAPFLDRMELLSISQSPYIPSVTFLIDGLIRLASLHYFDKSESRNKFRLSKKWTKMMCMPSDYYLTLAKRIDKHLKPKGLLDENALGLVFRELMAHLRVGPGSQMAAQSDECIHLLLKHIKATLI
ncbi:hypothetical protein AA313_de0209773 [Arthrobotrys entomopaga]|nr:hypothetical protein AA313_de0209773 [Arthrobotrys entomopaga]